MVIQIAFRTQDAVNFAIACKKSISLDGYSKFDCPIDERELRERLSRWIRNGESITLQYDLDANTMSVVEASS